MDKRMMKRTIAVIVPRCTIGNAVYSTLLVRVQKCYNIIMADSTVFFSYDSISRWIFHDHAVEINVIEAVKCVGN